MECNGSKWISKVTLKLSSWCFIKRFFPLDILIKMPIHIYFSLLAVAYQSIGAIRVLWGNNIGIHATAMYWESRWFVSYVLICIYHLIETKSFFGQLWREASRDFRDISWSSCRFTNYTCIMLIVRWLYCTMELLEQ